MKYLNLGLIFCNNVNLRLVFLSASFRGFGVGKRYSIASKIHEKRRSSKLVPPIRINSGHIRMIHTLGGWLTLGPSSCSQNVLCFCFFLFFLFLSDLFCSLLWCPREKWEIAQLTHPHLAVPVALDPRVDPTPLPRMLLHLLDERANRAVSHPGMQPS